VLKNRSKTKNMCSTVHIRVAVWIISCQLLL